MLTLPPPLLETLAKRIVDYRERNSLFKFIQELTMVSSKGVSSLPSYISGSGAKTAGSHKHGNGIPGKGSMEGLRLSNGFVREQLYQALRNGHYLGQRASFHCSGDPKSM